MNFYKIDKELSNMVEELSTIISDEENTENNPEVKTKIHQLFQKSSSEWNKLIWNYLSSPELDINRSDFESIDNDVIDSNNNNENTEGNNVNEVNRLKGDLIRSENARKKLSQQIDKMIEGSHKTMKYYQESISLMDQTLKENERTQMKLEEELSKLRKEVIVLAINKEILETNLNELQGINETENLLNWFETKEIRSSLQNSEKKIEELHRELQNLKTFKIKYDERELMWRNEIKSLNMKLKSIEQDKEEAVASFEVLSNYLSERNMILRRELKEQEEYWTRNPCDQTILQQMEILKKENLKAKRLLAESRRINQQKNDQERKLKRECEQKDIENLLLTMKSERKIKSLEMEAAELRRQLLLAESKILATPINSCRVPPSTSILPPDIDYQPIDNNLPINFYTCATTFHQRDVKTPSSMDEDEDEELEQDIEEDDDEEVEEEEEEPVNIKPEVRSTETCTQMPIVESLLLRENYNKITEVADIERLPFLYQQVENDIAAEENQEMSSEDGAALSLC
ncbi:hypothetical protein O3M35_009027 [Rhynocoris fuscipes]|uniref:Uncharacterized protein n=1 Tax=Rhynocoris fuscipes TaxID=488301 RepID=A0AAW1D8F6_9HEMI